MIYLYSLPGINLTYPEITNPMIKGNLNKNKCSSKHIDLTEDFLSLLKNDKEFFCAFNMIKSSDLLFEDRLRYNDKISLCIQKYFNKYNIDYVKKAMSIKTNINTVSKLDDFLNSGSIELEVFDSIFDISNIKNGDYIYVNVAYNFQFPYALRFAKKIKDNCDVKVILGGNYLTHIKDNVLEIMEKFDYIDSIFYYANYDSLYKIISFFENENNKLDCDCIVRKSCLKEFTMNGVETNDFTTPDFSDITFENYLSYKNVAPMLLSKGCYYNKCNFCAHHYFYKCRQLLDVDNICECVKCLVETKKIEGIIFVDECINPKDIFCFANYLIENNIKINWLMETRISADYLDDENCCLLEKSGCKLITFGVESASQRVLNLMNKGIEFKLAKRVLKKIFNTNIIVSSTYMIGYPNERKYETNKTLYYLKRFKYLDGFGINQFNFVRNSKIATDSKVNVKDSMDLFYSYRGQKKEYYHNKIVKLYSNKKINKYKKLRDALLNRSDYLFLNKSDISLNFKSN